MTDKAMTLRLDADLAEGVKTVAEVDGTTVTDTIRNAIADRVRDRLADPEFKARLSASMERQRAVLDRLA